MEMNHRYIKGSRIRSLDELMKQDFIFHRQKVLHIGWFQNWSLKQTQKTIVMGHIFCAIKEKISKED